MKSKNLNLQLLPRLVVAMLLLLSALTLAVPGRAATVAPIASLDLTIAPTSPTAVGISVELSAVATGGTALEYQFQARYTGSSGTVSLTLQDYSLANSCFWTPTEAHDYTIVSYVRETGTIPYAIRRESLLKVNPAISGLSVVALPVSPVETGVPITFSPTPVDGGTLEYRYEAKYSIGGGSYFSETLREYSWVSDFTWTPTEAHDYTVSVSAREIGSVPASPIFIVELPYNIVAPSGPGTVNLGTAGSYAILAQAGITTTGVTAIVGNVGISPAALSYMTGFSETLNGTYATSPIVTGKIYAADMDTPTPSNLTIAIGDKDIAFTDAAGRTTPDFTELYAGDVSGKTLVPGLYKWSSGLLMNTDVTLAGGPQSTWIFQIAGDLTVSTGVNIILIGGAQLKNIVWQVAGQTVLEANSSFNGVILCATQIVMKNGAVLNGRALAKTAVTMIGNSITAPATPYDMNVTDISAATSVNTGELRNVVISGAGFKAGATVELQQTGQPNITGTFVTVNSSTSINCDFYFTGNHIGPWDLVVTNTDNRTASIVGAITLTVPPPRVVSLTTTSGTRGQTVTTKILGNGFADNATVKGVQILGSLIIPVPPSNVTHLGQNCIAITLDIPALTPVGYYQVVVTNPGTPDVSSTEDVMVYVSDGPAPVVTGITPAKGTTGEATKSLTIKGSNFNAAATVKLTNGATTINATSVIVTGGSSISCTVNLTGKATGLYDVVVTNPDTQAGTLKKGFAVTSPQLTGVTLTTSPSPSFSAPPVVGTTIVLTANPTKDIGVTDVDYAYYARYYNTATQVWVDLTLQGFTLNANTYNWKPTVALNYYLHTVARIHGTTTVISSTEVNYPISNATLTGLKMTIGNKDINNKVLLTATKVGTAPNVEYYFYGYKKVAGKWSSFTIRTYNGLTTTTAVWTVTSTPTAYKVVVLARLIGSTSSYQVASPIYDTTR